MVHPITQSSFTFLEGIKIYGFGLCSDVFVFTIASGFLWLYLIFLSNSKYNKPYGYIIFGLLLSLLGYVTLGNTILDEYGGALPKIGIAFVGIKTVFFGLFLFLPQYRERLRLWMFSFVIFLYVLLLLQNGISEYFFWNEFGVKYNFIAVNYLIYTNEVIEREGKGESVSYLIQMKEKKILGVISFKDKIKKESFTAIKKL
jgi:hypothetical protein